MSPGAGSSFRLRPLERRDIPACIAIRTASIADYQGRLSIAYRPGEVTIAEALLDHLRITDPARVVVAERVAGSAGPVFGYAAASMRGVTWFLGSLFVAPSAAGEGIGTALLGAILPADPLPGMGQGPARMTSTDSLQPISNVMYARLGMVPRVPVFRMESEARVIPPAEQPWLVVPIPRPDDPGWSAVMGKVGEVDRQVLGYTHDADHAFVRRHATEGLLVTTADHRPLGYGYRHPSGELGPIAALDADLLPALLRMMAARTEGQVAVAWAAGASDRLLPALLRWGFRAIGYPALACWDRATVDLARYVPWSLTIL